MPEPGLGTMAAMRALDLDDLHLFARVSGRGTLLAVARERNLPVRKARLGSRTLRRIDTKACIDPGAECFGRARPAIVRRA